MHKGPIVRKKKVEEVVTGCLLEGERIVVVIRGKEKVLERRRSVIASSPRTGNRRSVFSASRRGIGRETAQTEGVVRIPVQQQTLCKLLKQATVKRICSVFHLQSALRLGFLILGAITSYGTDA